MRALTLTSTRKEYALSDESGYRFQIVAELDEEFGWQATVTFTTGGLKTDEDAVLCLLNPARAFVRMLEAAGEAKGR